MTRRRSTARARGIVAFDFDGTLIRGNTVCELLARPLGRSKEMRRFEGLSTKREIAESRRVMAHWYRAVGVQELCAPLEKATWRRGACEGIELLQANGIRVAIASITWRFAIEYLTGPLGVSNILATELRPAGGIGHVWPDDKGRWLRALAKQSRVDRQHIAAVGDSVNDRHLLSAASLRFFVGTGEAPATSGIRLRRKGDILRIAEEIVECWSPSPD